jgi:hypothetical protein
VEQQRIYEFGIDDGAFLYDTPLPSIEESSSGETDFASSSRRMRGIGSYYSMFTPLHSWGVLH